MPKRPLKNDPHGYGEGWSCDECGAEIKAKNAVAQCDICNKVCCEACLKDRACVQCRNSYQGINGLFST